MTRGVSGADIRYAKLGDVRNERRGRAVHIKSQTPCERTIEKCIEQSCLNLCGAIGSIFSYSIKALCCCCMNCRVDWSKIKVRSTNSRFDEDHFLTEIK